MEASVQAAPPAAKTQLIAGWMMTGLVILFMAMDTTMKLLDLQPVRATMTQMGWPIALDRTLGIIELACLVLYAVPRTAALGAILTTAFLGGTVASHLRLGDPLFTHVLFGVYIGLLAWGGLWFRDERLRGMIPLRG